MSAILKAIDVSSHQPRDLSALIATHQPQHVIVKGYLEIESPPQSHSIDQVKSAWNNACSAGMYVWCYRSASPYETIDDMILLCAAIGLELPLLWLDCETYEENGELIDPGPNADWLAKAVEYSESTYGMKCGIYTGVWWIDGHFPGGQGEFGQFNRLPLWLSDYDGNPDINAVELPIGWTEVAAKQYTSKPIDLNSIREEYTMYTMPPPPPVDPCDNLKVQLQEWRDRKPYKPVTRRQLRALDLER
jgi:GH25 family lysozyme M1 (1,4-beta-N-acetylmuramidase)